MDIKLWLQLIATMAAVSGFVSFIVVGLLKNIFITADGCKASKVQCKETVCAKLTELKSDFEAAEEKREASKKEFYDHRKLLFEELIKIGNFIGKVEQYMKDME